MFQAVWKELGLEDEKAFFVCLFLLTRKSLFFYELLFSLI